jgi:hypothetical protein
MELWMTIALMLYVLAFYIARIGLWRIHILSAFLGFCADMYATYLMAIISKDTPFFSASIAFQIHFSLALLAILAFLIQGWLGTSAYLNRKSGKYDHFLSHKNRHVNFAKKYFFRVWGLAYVTGFLLAF